MPQIDYSRWFQVDPWLIATVIISVIAFIALTIIWGIRAHRLQVSAGKEELVGKLAVVVTAMNPKGVVFIQGERWTAILDSGQVKPEEEVIITKVEGLKLRVTKKE